MEHSETPGEGLQLALTVPLPEEGSYPADNVTLPTGIFHVSDGLGAHLQSAEKLCQ